MRDLCTLQWHRLLHRLFSTYLARLSRSQEGDATHSGWLPHRNPLLCASGGLGLCLLYRYAGPRCEAFPRVCEENGINYKWLPLLINTEQKFGVDRENALLAHRAITDKVMNKTFNAAYAAVDVLMVLGDAVTHQGRYSVQQFCQNRGLATDIVTDALHYTQKTVQTDSYIPHAPLAFQLCAAEFPFLPEHREEVDAAHLHVMRDLAPVIKQLVDLVVPELSREDAAVGAIKTLPVGSSEKAIRKQKQDNRASHVREHLNFLEYARHVISLAIELRRRVRVVGMAVLHATRSR